MHNRKKVDKNQIKPLSEQELLENSNKRTVFLKTINDLLKSKKKYFRVPDKELVPNVVVDGHWKNIMAITEKIIRSNPDFYSLWNLRREMIYCHFPALTDRRSMPTVTLSTTVADETPNDLSKDNPLLNVRNKELALSEDGIRKNPKSCEKNYIYTYYFASYDLHTSVSFLL
jgi:hypothetical protein